MTAVETGADSGAEKKDLYEVGEVPPLGHVPKNMYAWSIRAHAGTASTAGLRAAAR